MRKSAVLIELIFSITLFSIIIIGSMKMVLVLYQKNHQSTKNSINIIKLEATRAFLIKNNNISNLNFVDSFLYYDGELLLDNISKFNILVSLNIATIDICLNKDSICQQWKIKTI